MTGRTSQFDKYIEAGRLGLVVTGSRNGHEHVESLLDEWVRCFGVPRVVICGDARGVDAQARAWAHKRGFKKRVLNADWKRFGRHEAGRQRNLEMVLKSVPGDHCVAFPSPTSTGTWDCVHKAVAHNLTVTIHPYTARVRKPGWAQCTDCGAAIKLGMPHDDCK